jgi:two-component system, NtrC family, sensor kinase
MTDKLPARELMTDEGAVHRERMATLGALTAGIAHELNNPIGYISSNLNTLRRYLLTVQRLMDQADSWIDPTHRAAWTQAQQHERWAVVRADLNNVVDETRQGAEHLKNVVNELKTLARTSLTTEHTSVDNCIASALTVLSHIIRHRCVIEQSLSAANQRSLIRSHMLQIIINLVHNACDAIPAHGGIISISTTQQDDKSVVVIEDNGPGIPVTQNDVIFTPFYTTKTNGTGLGLSLARRFAQQHGGDIICDQSPRLHGARFTVTIRDFEPQRKS